MGTLPLNLKVSNDESCGLLNKEPAQVSVIQDSLMEPNVVSTPVSPPANKKRDRKGKAVTPVTDSEVRRSLRVRNNNQGFKVSTCKSKNCIGCSSGPPTLSLDTIKEIGTGLCQLQEEELEESTLMGRNKQEPIGKKGKKSMDGGDSSPQDEDSGKF